MLSRRKRQLEVLNISALDLFASALGVFILMTLILFPFYLKQPALEHELEGAAAQGRVSREELALAEQQAKGASDELQDANQAHGDREADLDSARRKLQGARQTLARLKKKAAGARKRVPGPAAHGGTARIPNLDLVLVMDTTGSMHRAIADVQRSLIGMVEVLERLTPSLRVGFVAFKDTGDAYLTRRFALRSMSGNGLSLLRAFVDDLEASGGDDYPEPVGQALLEAQRMGWRDSAQGRIVLIGDAPDRRINNAYALSLADEFKHSNVYRDLPRRVSTVFTGHRRSGRQFYQRLAVAGGGDAIRHQGAMLSSVLLSVLDGPGR